MTISTERVFLRTVARRLYLKEPYRTPTIAMRVYLLESGEMLSCTTLEPWEPDDSWYHAETDLETATFVLLLKWSDQKTGDECIAICGSTEEARRFVESHNIGHYLQQIVKLVE